MTGSGGDLTLHTQTAGIPPGGALRRLLVGIVVATLPFTLALTIDLRFPLKIYELALLGVALTCFAQFRVSVVERSVHAVVPLLLLFGFALAVLTLHRWIPPDGLSTVGFRSRFGPVGDGVAKILYFALAVFGFLMVAYRTYRDEAFVLRLWLLGSILAAAYSWYLFASGLAGIPPFLLPGIDSPQMYSIAGRDLIRSGTFEEGNFLGCYLVLSAAIAMYARRSHLAVLLSGTVLITFSTVGGFGLVLFWGLWWWHRRRELPRRRRAIYSTIAVVLALSAGVIVLQTAYFQSVFAAKLVGESSISRLQRLSQTMTGLRMAAEHPVTGVGISQYGFYYDSFEFLLPGTLTSLQLGGRKPIPNNVYVELLSELGIVGFGLFAVFLLRIFLSTASPEMAPLRSGFLVLLVALNAFPTFSVMFLWAFFGVIIGAASRRAANLPTLRPA